MQLVTKMLLMFLLFTGTLFSQDFDLKGRIIDGSGEPLLSANVALLKAADSSAVGGDRTDAKGNFNFKAKAGNYILKVTFLSFETKYIGNIELSGDKNFGDITMQESSVLTEELLVQSDRLQAELKLDKRIFNVEQDTRNRGRNASEILESIPSVNVGVDGEVSLRGSGNVRILIDGKQSALLSRGDADALMRLQGNMIESIEVITNPSARYEAEGEVGIINIVLKKEKKFGTNGSFEANTGYPADLGGSFNVNYRHSFYNLFASYGINYRQNPGESSALQSFFNQDTAFYYKRDREHVRGGISNTLRFGSDVYITDNDVLTAAVIYEYGDGRNEADILFQDFNSNDVLTQNVRRTDNEWELEHNFEAMLDYKKNFSKKGHEFTANFKFLNNDDTERSDLLETSESYLNPIVQKSFNTEDEQTWLFQSDYIYPFGKEGKFETGAKIDNRRINNNFNVRQLDGNDEFQLIPELMNDFEYLEHIYAAYAMIGESFGRFSMQAGIRAEYTDISTELRTTQEFNPRSYLDWFPSTHMSYQLNPENTLQVSYSRRLSRPRFRWLLPFYGFSDNRNLFTGNPDLNPEYTNSFEVGNLYNNSKLSLLSNVYYRHRTGVIQRVMQVDSIGFTRMLPVNLSEQDAYGVEFNFNIDLMNNWTFNSSFNFYRAITQGTFNGEDFNIDNTLWTMNLNSKYKLLDFINIQPAFFYRAPQDIPQGRMEAIWTFDLGFSFDLDKNSSLTFSSRDMFNTRRRIAVTSGEDFISESDNQWRRGSFRLSYQYRLNQDKKQERPTGGAPDMGM